jgi:hypothetical protein
LIDGLRAGDVRALLTDDHSLAVRMDGTREPKRYECHDGATSAGALVSMFADVKDLTVLGRITSEWYVFAEYLARLNIATGNASARHRRVVAIHPVREGRLEGTFGYGVDE